MFQNQDVAEHYAEITAVPPPPIKLTNARKNRPSWAIKPSTILNHVCGDREVRQSTIAILYWCNNQSAQEIADELGETLKAVEMVLDRLSKKRVSLPIVPGTC
jgi:hypothetical protein